MTTLVTNNAFSTLASNISNVSTSLSVQSGEGARFPAPGAGEQAFLSLITAAGAIEIIKYTTRTGDAFSGLTRGSDGTTALSFNSGDLVELRVIAANYQADGILPNQTGHSGKFLKSVSLVAAWTQIANTDVSGLGTLSTQNGTFSGTSSGVNTGDQTITLTGDVTGSGTGSFAATIAANAVSFAKMVQIATARFLGRVTAGSGNVEELTGAQVKTALAIVPADVTGLALVASTGNAGDLTGTLSTAQLPALSGDVSNAVGSGVTAIGANKVTLAQMATTSASTILGRITAATGNVEALTAAQAKTVLGITGSDVSGLAAIAASGSASDLVTGTVPDARMPAHTGDVTSSAGAVALTIANSAVTPAKQSNINSGRLLGRVSAGTGVIEQLGSVPAVCFPALTGQVTTSLGSVDTTLTANTVSLAQMAQVATATILGRLTAATGNVEALTAAQAKTLLAIAQADVSGLTTASSPTFAGVTAKAFNQTQYTATISGATAIDYANGQSQILTMSGATSISAVNNVPVGSILRVAFIGNFNPSSWPASVKWVGGTAPTLNAGTLDRAVVVFENDGTYLLASSGVY